MTSIRVLASTALAIAALANAALFVAPASAKPDKDHKVTICHFTGSETNPVVIITIDRHALKHHLSNHNPPPHQGQDGEFLGDPDDENIICASEEE